MRTVLIVGGILAFVFATIAMDWTYRPDTTCLVIESMSGEILGRYASARDLPTTAVFAGPVRLHSPAFHLTISHRPPGWDGYRQAQYFPYGDWATCLDGEYLCAFRRDGVDGSGVEPRIGEIRIVVR